MKGNVKTGWIFHGNLRKLISAISSCKIFKKHPTSTTEYSQIGYEYDGTPDELRIINSEDNGDISFFHGSPTVSGVHKTVTITRLGTAPSHTPFLGVGTDVPIGLTGTQTAAIGGIALTGSSIVFGTKGSAEFDGDAFAFGDYYNVSDERLKENFTVLEPEWRGLLKIHTFSYSFKNIDSLNLPQGRSFGFKAQEVSMVFPELVIYNGHFHLLNYNGFIPLITAGIQEHENRITQLEKENSILKRRIEEIELLLKELAND